MRRFFTLLLWVTLMASAMLSFAQESILMVTYGSDSMTKEGDNDFKQVIFLQVPQTISDTLYLRIFDADCGDKLDSPFGTFDTETRFQLLGGAGAYSADTVRNPFPEENDVVSGTPIASEVFGVNPFRDNKWYNLTKFSPTAGEKVGESYIFKLVVEGLGGNDGNVFDIAVSLSDSRNRPPEGLEIFSYALTVRLPSVDIFAEMPFSIPAGMDEISVHNFDLAGAAIGVETAYRSNLQVAASGQGDWAESKVKFEKNEINRLCAVTFQGGGEIPNDATFYLTDSKDEAIPIQMPVYIRKANNRPVPQINIRTLSDGRTVVFDGSQSTDEDGEALEFFWDFGDGKSDSGVRITHRYEEVGDYSAEVIVSDDSGQVGNSSLKRFIVVINEQPEAKAGSDQVGIPGQTFRFDGSASVDTDGKIVRYVWDFGDGSRGEGAALSHVFPKSGIYEVTLRVEDDSESPLNFDTDSLEVWVNAPPVVEIGGDRISSPGEKVTFDTTRSHDSDGEIVEYVWSFGDGLAETGEIVNHAYSKPGRYVVTLTIKDNVDVSNNTASDRLMVVVNDQPVAEAGKNQGVSIDQVVYFDGSGSIDRDGEIIDYHWQFGDGAEARGKNVSHPYSRDGVYEVTLTVQDNSTSTSDKHQDTLTIIVNSPPVSVAGEDVVTTTSDVQLDGNVSGDKDGKLINYLWDFGDGTQGAGPAPLHIYRIPGTYKVSLTVTDDSGTSTNQATDELTIVVNEAPIADAGVDQIGAPGQEIIFDGSKSLDPDGQISNYNWDFGDGQTASGDKVSHTYENPGIYSVHLTVQDNTGHTRAVDQDEAIVSINAPPVADAGADIFAAPGQTMTFDGGGSYDMDGKIVSYQWRFSDGEVVTKAASKTERKFANSGIYSTTLIITDDSGAINAQAQDKVSIYVNHAPEARPGKNIVSSDVTISFDGSVSADADGDSLAYTWDFGDGTPPATGVKVAHTYAKGGTYPVVLTVDDGTGLANARNSASITVTINQPPIADAGEDRTIWAGDVVLFDGGGSTDPDGGLLKYYWDFGDGTTDENMNPTKIYKSGGVYQVTLTVKDDSALPFSSDVDQIVIRVAEAPVADAGPDQTVYANTAVQFDGSKSTDLDGVVNSFLWDFGDGSTGGGATPTHIYTEPGIYRVLLTIVGDQVDESDNTDKDEAVVTVVSAPEAKFSYSKVVAVNLPVQFDGSESSSEGTEIVSWEWDFGDDTSGEGEKISHTYKAPGRYPVKLTVKADLEGGIKSTSTRLFITVNNSPTAEAGKDQLVGVNQLTVLNGSGSKDPDGAIVSYDWNFGDGQTGSGIEVQHRYKTSGKYTVILKVTDNTDVENNSHTDTVTVTVNEAPNPVIDVADWVRAGQEVEFSGEGSTDGDGDIAGYHWDFGDTQSAEGAKASHTYNTPGRYEVILTVDDGSLVSNSRNMLVKTLMVNHPPIADAGPDQIVDPGETVAFDASRSSDRDGKIISYKWNFGDGTEGEGKQITHAYEKPGSYEVRLSVFDNSAIPSGTVEDVLVVIVNAPPVAEAGSDQSAFYGGAHDAVFFDGSESHDPDGSPLTFLWDFGDGTNETGAKVSHTYVKPGKYVVRLRVRDSSGVPSGETWDELTVEVKNR
ncbi:PKD domain-containing protein [Candidatus Poribacteria bacterium]